MSIGVKGAGTSDLGGTSYKRNCHRECCGSEGSIAIHLGSRAQLAGGGKGWGHRPGDRKEVGEVAPGAEAAGLLPRGAVGLAAPWDCGDSPVLNLACAPQDRPDLRRPSENREKKGKTAAAVP